MSHRENCPDDYDARREGQRAYESGTGSWRNPYGDGGEQPCDDAERAWRSGYRSAERDDEERRAEERDEQRRAETARCERESEEAAHYAQMEQEQPYPEEPYPQEESEPADGGKAEEEKR